MRKSKHISKYNLEWQCIRVQCKDLKTVEDKCMHAAKYLEERQSEQAWERVVNYLEGLEMGYRSRNQAAVDYIRKFTENLGTRAEYGFDSEESFSGISWDEKTLRKCYKDNMRRYENYCKKGYFHKEIYEFVKTFQCADVDKIEQLKTLSESKDNEHHFFF